MRRIEKKVQDTLNPPPPISKAEQKAQDEAKKEAEKKELKMTRKS